MGEYAYYKDGEVKIGTCEEMMYLRWEDRHIIDPKPNNVDPKTTPRGLFFRLPFPDEDHLGPGSYDPPRRGVPLYGYRIDDGNQTSNPGIIQISHESGMLINVPCYHGAWLPMLGEATVFWNGKAGAFFELRHVKATAHGIFPTVACRFCGRMWSTEWDEVLPYVHDTRLQKRLAKHNQ